jgi:hypothetical protein
VFFFLFFASETTALSAYIMNLCVFIGSCMFILGHMCVFILGHMCVFILGHVRLYWVISESIGAISLSLSLSLSFFLSRNSLGRRGMSDSLVASKDYICMCVCVVSVCLSLSLSL